MTGKHTHLPENECVSLNASKRVLHLLLYLFLDVSLNQDGSFGLIEDPTEELLIL